MVQNLEKVEAVTVTEIPALDPIQVFWVDFNPGQGQVTINCYGEAWTAYWGAMGGRNVKQFFKECDLDYLTNRLLGAQFQKHTSGHKTYLARIIKAIKETL